MFDSLADRMKADDRESTNLNQRVVQWLLVGVLSVVLFGGLYMGIRLLEQ
jgi:hypothetical protein